MQLTSIEQCKAGMTVWHPIWGKGEVTFLMHKGCNVRFTFNGESRGKIMNEEPDNMVSNISHLYTEPVFICTKVEYKTENEHGMQFNVTHYEPIKPESK